MLRQEAPGADYQDVAGSCEAYMEELTDRAMEALSAVATCLAGHGENLSPSELRTYLWARSSLAVGLGIRAESITLDDGSEGN